MNNLSVPPSAHMTELLNNDVVARSIALSYKDIELVLVQTALDVINEGNVSTIAPNLLGIKNVQDILLLFKTKGDVIIEKENKQNKQDAKK